MPSKKKEAGIERHAGRKAGELLDAEV